MKSYDVSDPISPRIGEKENPQDEGMEEIASELRRCCKIYEEELRNSQKHVSRLEIEQRVAETYAKKHGMWISA